MRVDGGRLEGAGRYAVVLEDGVDRADLDGVNHQGGVYLYEDSEVGLLTIRGCDIRGAVNFPAAAPEEIVAEFDAIANDGGPSTIEASGNSGNGGVSAREVSWIEADGQRTPIYDL